MEWTRPVSTQVHPVSTPLLSTACNAMKHVIRISILSQQIVLGSAGQVY